jgi:hypothetical protein
MSYARPQGLYFNVVCLFEVSVYSEIMLLAKVSVLLRYHAPLEDQCVYSEVICCYKASVNSEVMLIYKAIVYLEAMRLSEVIFFSQVIRPL